ncbi:MAG: FkbM family methyltransferase [Pirellulales bacterium]
MLVEVGAARPDYLSMSAFFRESGWTVISVEPNPVFCDLHRSVGNDVLCYACGDRDEDDVDFTIVDSHGRSYESGQVSFESFSSLGIKPEFASLTRDETTTTIKVKLRRLDTILATHAPQLDSIDMLAVDVEGWELEVLSGFNLKRYRPKCVVLENLFGRREYRDYMAAQGYRRWRCLPPNEVFVSDDAQVTRCEIALLQIVDRIVHGAMKLVG